jgi:hypothetical protein
VKFIIIKYIKIYWHAIKSTWYIFLLHENCFNLGTLFIEGHSMSEKKYKKTINNINLLLKKLRNIKNMRL